MEPLGNVIYIKGLDGPPEDRDRLPALWKPFGLNVVPEPIDWARDDYATRLQEIGARILELSDTGDLSIVGDSAGGKAALELFATYSSNINCVITVNSKYSPYEGLSEKTRLAYPNLVISSDSLEPSLPSIDGVMRQNVLSVTCLEDVNVAPAAALLPGANHHIVQAAGHHKGIERALTVEAPTLVNFIIEKCT